MWYNNIKNSAVSEKSFGDHRSLGSFCFGGVFVKGFLSGLGRELLGGFLFAAGMYNFAIAARLPLVGFSGVAFIVNRLTGLPVGWALILLNVPVAALCFRVLGRGFFLRSVRCTVISSLMLDYLVPLLPVYTGERLLAALAAGTVSGLGLALIYTGNSSTGGMDFITISLKTLRPYLKLGHINLAFDIAVIGAESLMLRDADGMIYGLMVSFIMSLVVDKVIFGMNSGKLALIVTEQGRRITQVIEDTCHRGSTLVPGFGGYRGREKQVVVCACGTKQMVELLSAVKEADPMAFTMVLDSSEIHGEGFRTVSFGDRQK